MNRLCLTKKSFLFAFTLGIALCVLFGVGLASCSNLGDDDVPSKNISFTPNVQLKAGEGIVSGTVQDVNSTARTAMPTFPTIASYGVTADNGATQKNTTAISSGSGYSFSLLLPYGTWNITVSAKDSGGNIILSQTKEITLNESNSAITEDFEFSYTDEAAKGNINLSIKFPKNLVREASYELSKGGTSIISGNLSAEEIAAEEFTISKNNVSAGSYNLIVKFFGGAGGDLIFRIDQTVNVFGGLTTNKFVANAGTPYLINDGKITIREADINAFALSIIYVGGVGLGGIPASDGQNTGSAFDPLGTLSKAINTVNISPLNPIGGFTIIVQGNNTGGSDRIALDSGKKVTIMGSATERYTMSETHLFSTAGDLTIENLTFEHIHFEVTDGSLEMKNCTIKGNSIPNANMHDDPVTSTKGGAINISNGTVTLTNCTISENTATGNGGAIYVSSVGILDMVGGEISSNTADNGGGIYNELGIVKLNGTKFNSNTATLGKAIFARADIEMQGAVNTNGDDVYLGEDSSNDMVKIFLSENITGTGKPVTITPSDYEVTNIVLSEKLGETFVANSYTKFAVTPQSNGTKWAVDDSGFLVLDTASSTKLASVYLNSAAVTSGDGTESSPVKTLTEAFAKLDTDDSSPKIIVMSEYTISSVTEAAYLNRASASGNKVTIQRYYKNASTYYDGNLISIACNTTLANITFDGNWKAGGGTGAEQITNCNGIITVESGSILSMENGSTLANNSCEFYNAGCIYNNGEVKMNGGLITDNWGKGIYNYGSLTINGGTISNNEYGIYNNDSSATTTIAGGSIINNETGIDAYKGTVTITNGTISGNSNASTSYGVNLNGNGKLEFSGSTKIADDNIIYLNNYITHKPITITSTLSSTGTVAKIGMYSYDINNRVLAAGTGVTIDQTLCDRFVLDDSDYTIIPDATGKFGIAVKPTVPGGITITIAGSSYSIKPTVDSTPIATGSTVAAGSTINFSVADAGGNVTGTSVIQLKDMGGGVLASGTNSLTVPAYLGGRSNPCQLYMGLTLSSGVVVDTTININVE